MFKIPSKAELIEAIRILPDNDKYRYVLANDLVYKVKDTIFIVVPKGFKFDGDSNPFQLNKYKIDYDKLVATIPHDYGYQTQFLFRLFWDTLLFYILKDRKGLLTAWIYYVGVRVFGIFHWRNNQKNLQKFPEAKEKVYKLMCSEYEKEN